MPKEGVISLAGAERIVALDGEKRESHSIGGGRP